MTREDIFRMAQEVELINKDYDLAFLNKYTDKVERFAALVASTEREACAKVCEEQMQGKSIWIEGARACSLAIRARGQA